MHLERIMKPVHPWHDYEYDDAQCHALWDQDRRVQTCCASRHLISLSSKALILIS